MSSTYTVSDRGYSGVHFSKLSSKCKKYPSGSWSGAFPFFAGCDSNFKWSLSIPKLRDGIPSFTESSTAGFTIRSKSREGVSLWTQNSLPFSHFEEELTEAKEPSNRATRGIFHGNHSSETVVIIVEYKFLKQQVRLKRIIPTLLQGTNFILRSSCYFFRWYIFFKKPIGIRNRFVSVWNRAAPTWYTEKSFSKL